MGAFGWVKQHYLALMRIGGAMLVVIGLLLVTGAWNDLVVGVQVLGQRLHPGGVGMVDQTLTSAPARDVPPEPRPPALQPVALRPLGLAAADLDADGAGPAVPAGARRGPGLAGAAAQHRRRAGGAVRRAAPDPRARGTTGFGLFDVYSSPWFAAIYLLLFVSLVGCVLPRSRQHLSAVLARPPRAPRNLHRLPQHATVVSDRTPEEALAEAQAALRSRRFRVQVVDGAVSAEKGYLRETGNLVFHLSLLLLLVAVGFGHLYGYKANVLVVEGEAFSNTVSTYDTWTPGALTDENGLAPFTVELRHLEVRYQPDGQQRGAPRDFRASVRYTPEPGARPRSYDLRVNHPLKVDGVKVFLLGNGYAPVFTVRDRNGQVVSHGAVAVPAAGRQRHLDRCGQGDRHRPAARASTGCFLPDRGARPGAGPDLGLPRAASCHAPCSASGPATSASTTGRRSRSTPSTRAA